MLVVLLNPSITINSVDLSNYITQVAFEQTWEEVDTTAFGGGGFKSRLNGLGDGKITIDWQTAYGGALVEVSLATLVGGPAVAFAVQPIANAYVATVTNPIYAGMCLVNSWQPVKGKVGELATMSVTWPTTGLISRSS